MKTKIPYQNSTINCWIRNRMFHQNSLNR